MRVPQAAWFWPVPSAFTAPWGSSPTVPEPLRTMVRQHRQRRLPERLKEYVHGWEDECTADAVDVALGR